MNHYTCGGCGGTLFFGNRSCLQCGRDSAYLPSTHSMVSVDYDDQGQPVPLGPDLDGGAWLHCTNRQPNDVCFWLVDPADQQGLCRSCRLTSLIPDLTVADNLENWRRVEAAKQRLIHSLLDMGLPVDAPLEGIAPLSFHLLASQPATPVITGHLDSLITLDVAEADDAERARRREVLGEPYRTLLGHLRHEVGHFYWSVLGRDPAFVAGFRERFGDEQIDYQTALQRHYENGPPANWQTTWITAYASCHPWEDWAECWAHFLHLSDAVQTACAHGLSFSSQRLIGSEGSPMVDAAMPRPLDTLTLAEQWPLAGDVLLDVWQPISLLVNDLNRAVGMPDAYPFVVSRPVRDKIAFISEQARLLAERSRDGDPQSGWMAQQ